MEGDHIAVNPLMSKPKSRKCRKMFGQSVTWGLCTRTSYWYTGAPFGCSTVGCGRASWPRCSQCFARTRLLVQLVRLS